MIKFTDITDKLKYPPRDRARLTTLHAKVVEYVCDNFVNSYTYRKHIANVLNTISFMVLSGDHISDSLSGQQLCEELTLIDDSECKAVIKDLYMTEKQIEWNLSATSVPSTSSPSFDHSNTNISATISTTPQSKESVKVSPIVSSPTASTSIVISPTPKEDLYIRPPVVPRLDVSKPWYSNMGGNTRYVIYTSKPEIPTKQNEISVSTDINKMTSTELMQLYPNRFIRTRSSVMYERLDGVDYDTDLGLLIPVDGFTPAQIRDNIIRYPHIFKLMKCVNDEIVRFYTSIEIDGQLYKTSEVWDSLPVSKSIPRNPEFVKEYVVRRYLLERDILGVSHKYPLYGSLDPYLTLFTTPDHYIQLGYSDVLDIAKCCVAARVSYKQTRNPILRRFRCV